MKYVSTRAPRGDVGVDFETVLMNGIAPDGGLYVPKSMPVFAPDRIAGLRGKPYADVAFAVMRPFVDAAWCDDADLHDIIARSYDGFIQGDDAENGDILPVRPLSDDIVVAEMFHGPTLAFKDFALQFLGTMFDYALAKAGQMLTIIGATSGDTGSAAIAACRDKDAIEIFILHPKGRVSEVQRRQMTGVPALNVHNIAIEGTFDDCQDIAKELLGDADLRVHTALSAINSINWARIMAQVAYYAYLSLAVDGQGGAVNFAVPTGNFGNIYAGYLARKMGFPIGRLIIGTNANDILYRFARTGEMKIGETFATSSPSMDIQVSSNFERLLFALLAGDGARTRIMMQKFRTEGGYRLTGREKSEFDAVFSAWRADNGEVARIISVLSQHDGYVADPHSAIAIGAARAARTDGLSGLIVALATAHPAKFAEAVFTATGQRPALPARAGDLFSLQERYKTLPADSAAVKNYVLETLAQRRTAA